MKPNFTFRHGEVTQNPAEPQKKFEAPRFSWPTVEGPTEGTESAEGGGEVGRSVPGRRAGYVCRRRHRPRRREDRISNKECSTPKGGTGPFVIQSSLLDIGYSSGLRPIGTPQRVKPQRSEEGFSLRHTQSLRCNLPGGLAGSRLKSEIGNLKSPQRLPACAFSRSGLS